MSTRMTTPKSLAIDRATSQGPREDLLHNSLVRVPVLNQSPCILSSDLCLLFCKQLHALVTTPTAAREAPGSGSAASGVLPTFPPYSSGYGILTVTCSVSVGYSPKPQRNSVLCSDRCLVAAKQHHDHRGEMSWEIWACESRTLRLNLTLLRVDTSAGITRCNYYYW